jgi:hypothetical protein
VSAHGETLHDENDFATQQLRSAAGADVMTQFPPAPQVACKQLAGQALHTPDTQVWLLMANTSPTKTPNAPNETQHTIAKHT